MTRRFRWGVLRGGIGRGVTGGLFVEVAGGCRLLRVARQKDQIVDGFSPARAPATRRRRSAECQHEDLAEATPPCVVDEEVRRRVENDEKSTNSVDEIQ